MARGRVIQPATIMATAGACGCHSARHGLGGAVTADSGLALFESLSYRTFSVGENGFTWAGSRFDRPESEPEPEPELRELRLLLQVFVGGWYIAIADVGGLQPLRVTCWASINSAQSTGAASGSG